MVKESSAAKPPTAAAAGLVAVADAPTEEADQGAAGWLYRNPQKSSSQHTTSTCAVE